MKLLAECLKKYFQHMFLFLTTRCCCVQSPVAGELPAKRPGSVGRWDDHRIALNCGWTSDQCSHIIDVHVYTMAY